MANVKVTCQNFPAAYNLVNGTRFRSVQKIAVLRAAITLGLQSMQDFLNLNRRVFNFRFGIGLSAISFLEQTPQGLCLSSAYKGLDMSEKVAASYWYGMIFAKIIANSELNIPWLAHADPLIRSGALIISSRSRGDCVGKDINNNWHVIEAKGYSSNVSPSLISKAKSQASTIQFSGGITSSTTSACVTYLSDRPISVVLDDPPNGVKDDDENWELNSKRFFKHYYKSIISFINKTDPSQEDVSDQKFITTPSLLLPWIHGPVKIGLLATIYERPEEASNFVNNLQLDEQGRIGSDGIAIFGEIPEWELIDDKSVHRKIL